MEKTPGAAIFGLIRCAPLCYAAFRAAKKAESRASLRPGSLCALRCTLGVFKVTQIEHKRKHSPSQIVQILNYLICDSGCVRPVCATRDIPKRSGDHSAISPGQRLHARQYRPNQTRKLLQTAIPRTDSKPGARRAAAADMNHTRNAVAVPLVVLGQPDTHTGKDAVQNLARALTGFTQTDLSTRLQASFTGSRPQPDKLRPTGEPDARDSYPCHVGSQGVTRKQCRATGYNTTPIPTWCSSKTAQPSRTNTTQGIDQPAQQFLCLSPLPLETPDASPQNASKLIASVQGRLIHNTPPTADRCASRTHARGVFRVF